MIKAIANFFRRLFGIKAKAAAEVKPEVEHVAEAKEEHCEHCEPKAAEAKQEEPKHEHVEVKEEVKVEKAE